MFMREKQNKTALLIWTAPHKPFIHSVQTEVQHKASWLERMCLLTDHATTKQRCEIQWEVLEFSEEHKRLV